jgi:hypothetical protein
MDEISFPGLLLLSPEAQQHHRVTKMVATSSFATIWATLRWEGTGLLVVVGIPHAVALHRRLLARNRDFVDHALGAYPLKVTTSQTLPLHLPPCPLLISFD